jgi:hypothetical protein
MTTYNITTARRTPNRRVTKFTKIIVSLILAPFLIAAFVGTGIGIADAIHHPAAATVTKSDNTVTNYNDGWIDAKRDDCEQGVKIACQWLDQQHISH